MLLWQAESSRLGSRWLVCGSLEFNLCPKQKGQHGRHSFSGDLILSCRYLIPAPSLTCNHGLDFHVLEQGAELSPLIYSISTHFLSFRIHLCWLQCRLTIREDRLDSFNEASNVHRGLAVIVDVSRLLTMTLLPMSTAKIHMQQQ